MRQPRSQRAAGVAIELFQMAFLEVASVQLRPSDLVIKGGANLRFFYASRRRSRDMDFDYLARDFGAFAEQVDRVFVSRALETLLRTRELALQDLRRSKQTATTRRWKFALAAADVSDATSKIEFSARGGSTDRALAAVDPELARRLRGRVVRLPRYGPIACVEQKVGALASRGETQPRDVFDLDHLFREHPQALAEARLRREKVRTAVARALDLSYEEYRSTVVDYLEEEFVDALGTEEAWTQMVLAVTARLEEWQARQ